MNTPQSNGGDLELILELYRGVPVGSTPARMQRWIQRAATSLTGEARDSTTVKAAFAAAAAVHDSFATARRLGAAALRKAAARPQVALQPARQTGPRP